MLRSDPHVLESVAWHDRTGFLHAVFARYSRAYRFRMRDNIEWRAQLADRFAYDSWIECPQCGTKTIAKRVTEWLISALYRYASPRWRAHGKFLCRTCHMMVLFVAGKPHDVGIHPAISYSRHFDPDRRWAPHALRKYNSFAIHCHDGKVNSPHDACPTHAVSISRTPDVHIMMNVWYGVVLSTYAHRNNEEVRLTRQQAESAEEDFAEIMRWVRSM